MAAAKIDCSQIPKVEMNNLCRTLVTAAERFFENPENQKRFEAWKAARAVEQI